MKETSSQPTLQAKLQGKPRTYGVIEAPNQAYPGHTSANTQALRALPRRRGRTMAACVWEVWRFAVIDNVFPLQSVPSQEVSPACSVVFWLLFAGIFGS